MKALSYAVFVVRLLWYMVWGGAYAISSFIIVPFFIALARLLVAVLKQCWGNLACFYKRWVKRSGLGRVLLWHGAAFVVIMVVVGSWGDAPRTPQAGSNQAKEQVAPATTPEPMDKKPEEKPAPAEVKDTSPKGALGKGAWIIELDEAELGQVKQIKDPEARQSAQVKAVVAKAKKNGLGHIIVKTAHFGKPYGSCPPEMARELGEACRKAGIRCFGYGRILADDADAEAEMAKRAMRPARDGGLGLDGYVFDAEGEVKGKDKNLRLILADVKSWLKAAAPNKRLGYSSFGIPSYHRGLAWDTLNEFCHYAMPQLYWRSWQSTQKWSLDESLGKSLASWRDCPLPVVPTVQSYSGKLGGVARVEPAKMKKFLAGLDTSSGFNSFRWDYTGPEQWQVIRDFKCGQPSYKLKVPAEGKQTSAASTTMPKMPLEPTGKGDLTGMVVVIDPGHGGTDPGMGWKVEWKKSGKAHKLKAWEAAVTYPTSWQLAATLRSRGAYVYLTAWDPIMAQVPTGARDLPLPRKATFTDDCKKVRGGMFSQRFATVSTAVKRFDASGKKLGWRHVAFVSIHVDSLGGNVSGAHAVCWPGDVDLGEPIAAELAKIGVATPGRPLWEKTKRMGIIAPSNVPLRLRLVVEMGVPANDGGDSWRLRSQKHRQKIIDAIANGLAAVND
ncbi:MAG: N-acetylmuramoyl-L-alanine amidase [bacterium ADurb.Bin212]|nr:MAG: N-acetylmuramoyl-L-alanine amidase [bacterium ADurb.Bin212]